MAWDDTGDPNAQDWFEANAPPPADPFADQVNALYQQYYHTDAPPEAIQAHRGNPGGLPAIEKMLQDSMAAAPPSAEPDTPAPTGGTPSVPPSANYQPAPLAPGVGIAREPGGGFSIAGGHPDYVTPPPTYASNPAAPPPPAARAPLSPYVASTWQGGAFTEPTPMASYVPPPLPANLQTPYAPPPLPANLQTPYAPPPLPAYLQTPYVAPTFTAPTQAQLEASPGYQSRLAAGLQMRERSAAAQGSILSGGTQQELARYGQDYASNEYGNLFGQDMSGFQANTASGLAAREQNVGEYNSLVGQGLNTRNQNVGEYNTLVGQGLNTRNQNVGEYGQQVGIGLATQQQNVSQANTGRSNSFQDYMAKYGQFNDQANLSLGARQQNVGEANTAFNQGQTSYQNSYGQYLDANSRTLQDYLTNLTAKRNQGNDYWSHLNDLYQTGATAATGSYRPGIGTT